MLPFLHACKRDFERDAQRVCQKAERSMKSPLAGTKLCNKVRRETRVSFKSSKTKMFLKQFIYIHEVVCL